MVGAAIAGLVITVGIVRKIASLLPSKYRIVFFVFVGMGISGAAVFTTVKYLNQSLVSGPTASTGLPPESAPEFIPYTPTAYYATAATLFSINSGDGRLLFRDFDWGLSRRLRQAGYEGLGYYRFNGGFAIVTAMEKFEDDGRPSPLPYRWATGDEPRIVTGSGDFFRAFIFPPEGNYRVFVFILSDKSFRFFPDEASRDIAKNWNFLGVNTLPREWAQVVLSASSECTILLYQFRKDGKSKIPRLLHEGFLPITVHLKKSGIIKNGEII